MTRRHTFAGALLLLSKAIAQSKPSSAASHDVFQHDLPNLTMDDWQVTASEIDIEPGHVGRPHRHPGFVLVYVLEGAVVTGISDQPLTTYSQGQMFYEPPGSKHLVSRNASNTQPAKILAMIFAKKGVPLTEPVSS